MVSDEDGAGTGLLASRRLGSASADWLLTSAARAAGSPSTLPARRRPRMRRGGGARRRGGGRGRGRGGGGRGLGGRGRGGGRGLGGRGLGGGGRGLGGRGRGGGRGLGGRGLGGGGGGRGGGGGEGGGGNGGRGGGGGGGLGCICGGELRPWLETWRNDAAARGAHSQSSGAQSVSTGCSVAAGGHVRTGGGGGGEGGGREMSNTERVWTSLMRCRGGNRRGGWVASLGRLVQKRYSRPVAASRFPFGASTGARAAYRPCPMPCCPRPRPCKT